MDNILAQYLFNKEILYKNPQNEIASEKKVIVAVAEEPKVIASPVVQTPKPIAPVAIPLKLNHKVLVIADVISSDEKIFLGRILGAVGLSLEQIDLIEIQKIQHIDYQSFINQQKTSQFISFGVGLSRLNWDIMLVPYEIRNVAGIDFLLANELGAIAADNTLKKALWTALQKMFGK
jgi:DNA polymerase III psi subunit